MPRQSAGKPVGDLSEAPLGRHGIVPESMEDNSRRAWVVSPMLDRLLSEMTSETSCSDRMAANEEATN